MTKVYFSPYYKYVDPKFIYGAQVVDIPEKADVIVFMGGTDVNPALYNQPKHYTTDNPDVRRDTGEMGLFLQYPDKVKLGICRGSQFLTVCNGGKLVQDVTNHAVFGTHEINFNGKPYEVTSTHHQMMFPFDLPEDSYEILGYTDNRSKHYKDGNDNELKVPVDPEVVYYPKTRTLACQSHPEFQDVNHPFVKELNRTLQNILGNV